MKIHINWRQPSTLRGMIWVVAAVISLGFLVWSSIDKAMAVMGIAGAVAGGVGLAVDDNQD